MTLDESKIQRLIDNVQGDAQGWLRVMDSITWVGGTGKRNPFYGKNHTPETIEILRQASTGRPKTAEERAKLSAATSGENNPFYGKHHTLEFMERLREINTGRPKTGEELAKLSAAKSGENNPFYGKHHTDISKRQIVETKIRNGTLGRVPDKTITLLQIVKELADTGVDKYKIAALALKLMNANGMKISRVQAYRVLPQEYKNPNRVISTRNSKIRKL